MDLSNAQIQAPTGHPPHEWTAEEEAHLENALRTVAKQEDREHSLIPGAHEFAGRPPPTPEDEARLKAALDKIFSKESKMEQATPTVDMNEVIEKSAEAANELLAQDGWAIVHQLHEAALALINQTGLVVLPIMTNIEQYKLKLTDPVGFEKRFATLSNDVTHLMVAVKALGEKSAGKKGKPTAEELDTIGKLTMDYTKVQGHIEQAVQPLILVLIEELEAVGITELKVEA
jgi:hypothetical protein